MATKPLQLSNDPDIPGEHTLKSLCICKEQWSPYLSEKYKAKNPLISYITLLNT